MNSSGYENKRGLLVVISGFSGAGKGTLIKKLMSRYDNYSLSISATTRAPRPGESDGKDYFFVERQHFLDMIVNDELLEYARYVDNFYGTPRSFVNGEREKGKDCLLEIELQGAMKIKARCPGAVLIFVTPPSVEELERRLRGRGTESDEAVRKRMARAGEEAEALESYDYILINDDLDEAAERLHRLIQDQHFKMSEQTEAVKKIRSGLRTYYTEFNR